MNHWGESYPKNIDALVSKCEHSLISLTQKLNHKDCKTIGELYRADGERIFRQKELFENLGYIPNTKSYPKFKQNNEIKGLYLFGEKVSSKKIIPRYVGISGTIFRRLRQHCFGKLHNEATLAYLMASSESKYEGERKHFPYVELEKRQKVICNYRVAILPELLDFDLYFIEVYFAGKLKTLWNSFKTH
ncbi:MAG: hypothetical protein HY063_09455 [Bacteroidetes bacterium]|nr:hypothetical protein [Bacteroidota bacterium]